MPTEESAFLVERVEQQMEKLKKALEHYLHILKNRRLENVSPAGIEQFLLDIKDPEKEINLAKAELRQLEINLETLDIRMDDVNERGGFTFNRRVAASQS